MTIKELQDYVSKRIVKLNKIITKEDVSYWPRVEELNHLLRNFGCSEPKLYEHHKDGIDTRVYINSDGEIVNEARLAKGVFGK